ncbi:hypothetical protein [Parvibaculum sp. MBR-TMA-1.3b-4.2]|jgi:hypothetical protein
MSREPLKTPRSKFLMLALAMAHAKGEAEPVTVTRFADRWAALREDDISGLSGGVLKASLLIIRFGQSRERVNSLKRELEALAIAEMDAAEAARENAEEDPSAEPVQLDWWRRGQYG